MCVLDEHFVSKQLASTAHHNDSVSRQWQDALWRVSHHSFLASLTHDALLEEGVVLTRIISCLSSVIVREVVTGSSSAKSSVTVRDDLRLMSCCANNTSVIGKLINERRKRDNTLSDWISRLELVTRKPASCLWLASV